MKTFIVGVKGTSNFIHLQANNEKHAKQKFANLNHIVLSSFIVIQRLQTDLERIAKWKKDNNLDGIL
jgi:hypothetical protein